MEEEPKNILTDISLEDLHKLENSGVEVTRLSIEQNPDKLDEKWRNPDGTLKEGHPGMGGRPKGKTLKEWMREKLLSMTEEQREEFLKDVPRDMQWRMAEGNPQTDVTTAGKELPQPIINVFTNNSDKQDSGNEATNPNSAGGNVSKQDDINHPVPDSNGTVGQDANPN